MAGSFKVRADSRNEVLSEADGIICLDISSAKLPGAVLIIDADDFDFVRRHRWSPWQATNGVIYAAAELSTKGKRERVLLHRQIMRARFDEIIDHRNGNGLDDKKENLRVCPNNKLNMANRHARLSNTGFLGVCKVKATGKFRAHITVNTKRHELGVFDAAEDAARARDAFALKEYGEFAKLNFPIEEATRG